MTEKQQMEAELDKVWKIALSYQSQTTQLNAKIKDLEATVRILLNLNNKKPTFWQKLKGFFK